MTSPELVLITGAANGIGRSISLAVGKHNFNIAAWDVDKVGLDKLKNDLMQQNPSIKVSTYVVDVSDTSRVKEVQQFKERVVSMKT